MENRGAESVNGMEEMKKADEKNHAAKAKESDRAAKAEESDRAAKAEAEKNKAAGRAEESPAGKTEESEMARLLREFEAYKRETARESLKRHRAEELKKALRGAGVKREDFVELLAENMTLRGAWEKDGFDAGQIADEYRAQYGACFCETGMRGIERIAPPVDTAGGGDESNMSDEEYYRSVWMRKH